MVTTSVSSLSTLLKGPLDLGRTTHSQRLFPSEGFMQAMPRIRLFVLTALAAAALAAPAVAEAANPPKRFEGVTVKRYLMGRVKPTIRARGSAHLWTNTGFSSRRAVYPVVRHQVLEDGTEWLLVKALRNRTQVDVWVPKWATRTVWIAYKIKVDLSSRRATIYKNGKVARRFRVVVGANATPTPTGTWYVVDRMRLRESWAYGKWALATSAFSRVLRRFEGGQGQIALHARGSLTAPPGTAASHGCVRFRDGDIAWLAAHVPNGTTIQIQR
jgi:lipoprotein-anchoring transpeptidase ErfK/SrfK